MCSPRQGHALATRRQARSWADKEAALGHRNAKTHIPGDTLRQPGTSAGQEMLCTVHYQLPIAMQGTWKPGREARLCPERVQQCRLVVRYHYHLLSWESCQEMS